MSFGQLISRYVVAGALALAAADAAAVVMTVTVNSTTSSPIGSPLHTNWSTPGDAPQLEIAQFDNTPGGAFAGATLTGVEFLFTSNAEFRFEIISPQPGDAFDPATGSYKQTLKLNLKAAAGVPLNGGLPLAGLDNVQFKEWILSGNGGTETFPSASSSKEVPFTNSALSVFEGVGTVLFDVTAEGIEDESGINGPYAILIKDILGQARLSITYSYETSSPPPTTPNVPAPGALVLVGIGLVALGVSRRKG